MPLKPINNKNTVYLKGIIISPFAISFSSAGKLFYRGYIEVLSVSGISNKLPIVIDEKNINKEMCIGTAVKINANIRTRNYEENGIKKVDIYIFAYDIKQNNKKEKYMNQVLLEGYICKTPQIRYSATGNKLYLTILANNREGGIVNYIPCVFFEKDTKKIAQIKVGDLIQVKGRFQSRNYKKNKNLKTTYEMAVSKFKTL